jgi:hypothetical protein
VASGGFEVTLSDLYSAGNQFQAQAEQVLRLRETFESGAALPSGAFGNLPSSGEIQQKYQQYFDSVTSETEGLAKLATALQDGMAKLALSAVLYRVADVLAEAHAQLPAEQAAAVARQFG